MPRETFRGSKKFDEVLRDVHRLDRADAQTLDAGLVQNPPQQVFEFGARREVAAVSAKIDSAQHDFSIASVAKPLQFANYGVRRQAAALAANKRNHAKRAAGIASVLNLERGPRVIPFPSEHGRPKQSPLLENVAYEKFGRLICFRP